MIYSFNNFFPADIHTYPTDIHVRQVGKNRLLFPFYNEANREPEKK